MRSRPGLPDPGVPALRGPPANLGTGLRTVSETKKMRSAVIVTACQSVP